MTASPTSEPPHRTRMLWLCGLMHGWTHVYHVALLPLYLLIRDDLELGDVDWATSLVTIFGLSYFFPSYAVGMLADRYNRKHLLVIGLVINALGFIALSMAPTYGWAVAAVILSGMGGSFYHPAATALIMRLFPFRAGKALGWVGLGAGVGFFLSPLYTGWRADMAGWRAPVFELGLLGLAAALIFALLAVDSPGYPSETAPRKARSGRLFPTSTLWIWFLIACLAFSLRDFTGNGTGTLTSLFLQGMHSFTQGETGMALALIFLASIISNPTLGRLSDHGRYFWAALALSLAGLILVALPWLPTAALWPGFFAYGFFFMASYPMVEAALMEAVPDRIRGRVFGLFITVGGLVGTLAHWVIGVWLKWLGDKAQDPKQYIILFSILAGLVFLSLLGLPCLRILRRHHDDPGTRTPSETQD